MRAAALVLFALVGCGKPTESTTGAFDEQCTNSVDDDGDGLADCDDPDCALVCDTGDSGSGDPTNPFTGTTGVTNPASPLAITIDPTVHEFQHEVGATECPQSLGRIIFDNNTDAEAQIIVSATRVDGKDLFNYELVGETAIDFYVDWPIAAHTQGQVWVYYACTAAGSFFHQINVDFHNNPYPPAESNAAVITVEGHIL